MGLGRGGLGVAAVWGSGVRAQSRVVERMLAAAPHRGESTRVVETSSGSLGVSGDASVRGLCSEDGWALGFAGVIDDLVGVGFDEHSDGDGIAREVLTEIRRSDIESVARRLRGAYSVVVLGRDEVIYWRDHLGFASLFQRVRSDQAWVASEAKQIVAGAGLRREPDMDVVAAILLGATSDRTPSALTGVDRVPRRTYVRVGSEGGESRRYWDPNSLLERSDASVAEFTEIFSTRMDTAVRRMMRGPDAISLSGGVDSPLVAAYAAPAHLDVYGSPLVAVSNVYPDHPTVDERRFIELVAGKLGMPSNMMVPSALPTDGLETWVRLFDGPYPTVSVAESREFFQWSASLGYSVILTGEIAEYLTEMSSHTLGHLLLSARFVQLAELVGRERSRGRPFRDIARSVVRSSVPDAWMKHVRRFNERKRLERRPAWLEDAPALYEPPPTARTRWEAAQLSFFGGSGVLLEAHDTVTALCRVDVRRPYADIDVWETALGLRAEVKHGDLSRKSLLRSIARGRVPDEILDRNDKTVFDESLMAKIDYPELSRWLGAPRHRLPWIDYELLNDRIEGRSIDLLEFMWMKDLAAVHAFLEQW